MNFFPFRSMLLLFSAMMLALPCAYAKDSSNAVTGVRFGANGDNTRLVLDIDAPVNCSWFALSEPDRLVLDLPRIKWELSGTEQSGSASGLGLVSRYRYAHLNENASRLVLDLSGPAAISNHFSLAPGGGRGNRLVFDLESVSEQKFKIDIARPRIAPEQEQRRPIVVIDPGHGGHDPGATGSRGGLEKDLNLSVARDLASALRQTGRYQVFLTRSHDTYMKLEERVEKARFFEADLFISLHADAGSTRHVRGASVYTLSAGGAQRAEQLRLSQDWILPVELDNERPEQVNGILVDLIQSETKSESARFARKLIPSLKKSGWPFLRRTHRNAGFFVLLAPDVPAVLLEMGFLTNASDEIMLQSRRKRRPLIKAITGAIDDFFRERNMYMAKR